MTEQIYASNTPTIDIHIVMGTGSPTDPHIDASIPLDAKSSEFVTLNLDKPEFTEETLKGLGDIVLRKLAKILEEDKKND